jgi:diguanylate cyclase (GGDEF)-like protein
MLQDCNSFGTTATPSSGLHLTYSGHNEIKLTASFGVAQVSSDDQSVEEVIDRADSALYEAKHSGRNCVSVFGFVDLDDS